MQTVSETYAALLAAGAPKECRAIIAGVTYGEDKIVSAVTKSSFQDIAATVGNCIAKELNLVLRNPGEIPRMAQIQMQYRLNDGTTQSEWIPKGTYFIDTRDANGILLDIDAFDPMLKCDQDYTQSEEQGEWPKYDYQVVNEICTRIGVTLDSRTVLNKYYLVPYPGFGDGAYSMRDVLGFIGSAYAGNWVITDENKLRLITLGDFPFETFYLVTQNADVIVIGGDRIIVNR